MKTKNILSIVTTAIFMVSFLMLIISGMTNKPEFCKIALFVMVPSLLGTFVNSFISPDSRIA
jgi:hypothetical protein